IWEARVVRSDPLLTNEVLVVPLDLQVVDPVDTSNLLQCLDGDRPLWFTCSSGGFPRFECAVTRR
ncbi:MAG: hypothetical protein AAF627_21865, partial [Myxococcota bacterium]